MVWLPIDDVSTSDLDLGKRMFATGALLIVPENIQNAGYVHQNITISNNRFQLKGVDAISAKSVDGLNITGNLFLTPENSNLEKLIKTRECNNVMIKDNIIEKIKDY